MSATVLGLGLGCFILVLVWTVSILACLSFTRSQGIDGAIAPITVAVVITVILLVFPRERPDEPQKVDVTIVDHMYIPRMILVSAMCFFLIIGLVLLLIFHATKPVQAQLVRTK